MNIKDIAIMAKVSVSTVSKILNNKDADISEKTRKRVLKVVKDYQYVPYAKVRDSGLQKLNIIGVVLSKLYKESKLLSYYIEEFAKINGYSIIVNYTDQKENSEEKAIEILCNKKVEGIIILTLPDRVDDLNNKLKNENIPFIVLKNQGTFPVPSILYSEEQSGYEATELLIKEGHRNIGCILCESDIEIENKLIKGYTRALYKNQISLENDKIFIGKTPKEAGEIGVERFLSINITGIVCANSEISCCVYSTLQDKKVEIPRNISIINAVDSDVCQYLNPTLSAIETPYKKICQNAIELLVDQIESKKELVEPIKYVDLISHKRNSISKPPQGRPGLGKKIVVVGSMNMDVTTEVSKLPSKGETILAKGTYINPGGKGANQAVGAGKLGGFVYAIGRLGGDNDGKEIYKNLVQSAVKTDGIIFDASSVSGKAYINVAQNGESSIVVYSGANQKINKKQIKRSEKIFVGAQFCLLSLEIPISTAEYTITVCKRNNVKVILKPSAVSEIKENWLDKVDYIIPNEKEISLLVSEGNTIEEKAQWFFDKGVKNVIVTLGEKGCYLKNSQYSLHVPSADFIPLDTTGGADSFISALAVYLSEGNNLLSSIGFATYSAGISVTRHGVQPALPDRITLGTYKEKIDFLINNVLDR